MKEGLCLTQVIQTGSIVKMEEGDSITLVLPNGKSIRIDVKIWGSMVSVDGSILYSSEDPIN